MSITMDRIMERQYLREEYCCCDCGYYRNFGHHKGIRCPVTGRCGQCGSDWPCPDHADMVPSHLVKKVNRPSYVKKEYRESN